MIVFASALGACNAYRPFQPNPDEYERWSKPSDDVVAVRKAMLECGYPSPNGVRDRMIQTVADTTPDQIVMMYRCMSGSGYLYDGKKYDICRDYRDVESCRSNVPDPVRDVAKRLNGKFCHLFPRADACQP